MSERQAQLLVVDDNLVDRERVTRALGDRYAALEAATAADALKCAATGSVDCVLLDYRLPDADGLDTLKRLVDLGLPVVMFTGQGDERTAVEAMKRGAQDYLVKDALDAQTLHSAIESATEKALLRRRVEEQRRELERQLEQLERQRTELEEKNRALREREAKLNVILRRLPALVWTTDLDLACTSFAGSSHPERLDVGRALGWSIETLFGDDPSQLEHAHRAALRGDASTFEVKVRGRWLEGRAEPFRNPSGEIAGVIGAALDVTETRRLEEQFRQAQKMEALGQLASGVAHDFNNLLTVILSFGHFARDGRPADDPEREDLDEVLNAAQRGANLVRQLLTFSRQRIEKPRAVDVEHLVLELLPMLRRLVGADIEIELHPAPELDPARVDPGGLEQIIVNLAVNARDAMPRGGRLIIGMRNLSLSERLAIGRRSALDPGEYAVVSVSDEGPGIEEELRERIFEPFFSTKEPGRGTGLGLSTCYDIATQAGGAIGVYSEPAKGTTFRVYLPRASGEGETERPPRAAGGPARGTETILVLEDDPQVLRAVVRTLRSAGYRVLTASSPEEARERARVAGEEIGLILSDVVMPGSAGPELVEELRESLPGARVLYMSGYTGASVRRRGLLDAETPILEKPFASRELTRMVREVLGG